MKKIFCLTIFGLYLLFGCLVFSACGGHGAGLIHYEIVAQYDDQAQTLLCRENVGYVNKSDNALEEICFFVYANAFESDQNAVPTSYLDKAYPNGKSFGNLDVLSIKNGQVDAEYSFSEKKNILTVNLENKLFPNESTKIEIDFVINLANINHRLGYGAHATNFGNFFPIACVYENGFIKNDFSASGDPFFSESADFEITFSCPSDYVVASSGEQEKIYIEDGIKTTQMTGKSVRDFAIVVSKEFKLLQKEVESVCVKYYFYDDENAERHLNLAVDALSTYSKAFCDYPFSQLSVVKTNFCFGGMEYPNLVMISDSLSDEESICYVTAHEIGHQWWYSLVGNNQFSESWIDEGLTEFSTAYFFEKNPSYGIKYEDIINGATEHYKKFVEIYSKTLGMPVSQKMTRTLAEFDTEPEYVCNIYTKGMLLFDAVRKSMSDFKFFRCLRNYINEFKYQNVSKEMLISSFSRSCHRDLESFFNSWLEGDVIIK